MATKKPKTTTKVKTTKSKSTRESKAAVKTTAKVVAPAPEKTNKVEKQTVKPRTGIRSFFAKKYEGNDGILVIFKKPQLYGALIGEIIGSMAMTILFMMLFMMGASGMASISLYAVMLVGVFVAIYPLSGANLNPIITVSMMVTRRLSVIRGVLYMIAQVLGAWLAWLILNGFYLAGGENVPTKLPAMAPIADGKWGLVALIEFIGAMILGFFFIRAVFYKRSALSFAITVTGGIILAVSLGFIVSAAFVSLTNNFVFNPATAMMLDIFPKAGANFGEIFAKIMGALGAYVFIPMIGGVVGGYLAELAGKLTEPKEA